MTTAAPAAIPMSTSSPPDKDPPPARKPAKRPLLDGSLLPEPAQLLDGVNETVWIEVIQKMDEVYNDLLQYEVALEQNNAALEESHRFIASILASMSDILVVCDRNGLIEEVNPSFQRYAGKSEQALRGTPIFDLFADEVARLAGIDDYRIFPYRGEYLIADNKTVLMYIPAEKQLTRAAVKASEDVRVPFRLLLSRMDLHKVFDKIEFADGALKADPGDSVLRAFPKHGDDSGIHQVLLDITPEFDIRRLEVTFTDRSIMMFDFQALKRNVPIGAKLFQFTPPPGMQIIDQK